MEEELIALCKDFLQKITNMYFNGIITNEEFNDLSKNKIDFLKERGVVF